MRGCSFLLSMAVIGWLATAEVATAGSEGACCQGDGTCAVTTEYDCSGPCDFYRGDGTACDPFTLCPIQIPATCCTPDGGCEVMQPCLCVALGGEPGSPFETCADLPCEPTGACCRGNGQCEVTTADDCAGACDHFQGAATICHPLALCPSQLQRPCCLPNGTCEEMQPCQCEELGGQVNPGTRCDLMPEACLPPVGACCRANGVCELTTEDDCQGPCEVFRGKGTECGPLMLCPIQISRPCCLDDGTCVDAQPCMCEAMGGTVNPGFQCSTMPVACSEPEGACCRENGTCEITTAADCSGPCDFYRGDESVCSPFGLCPIEVNRPCCLPDGSCIDTQPCRCEAEGGTVSPGFRCETMPDACPDPVGGCCRGDFSCDVVTEAECNRPCDFYRGDGSDCTPPVLCPAQVKRPCCLPDGGCADLRPCECEDRGGMVNPGASCDTMPTVCPEALGACCRGDGVCEMTTKEACSGPCDHYRGDGTVCGAGLLCPIEVSRPCCLPDGSCEDTQPCVCNALGGTVAPGVNCAAMPGVCDPPGGACCRENGTCEVTTADDCNGPCDTYRGDGTTCGPFALCPIELDRPCCLPDGTCRDAKPCVCERIGGTVNAGMSCDTMPQDCPAPVGACCRANGVCEVTTADDCNGPCEHYRGDNTECDASLLCPIQISRPCCLPDGSCMDLQPCVCRAEGGTVNPGFGCDTMPVACPEPTGKCCRGTGICEDTTAAACNGPCDIYFGDDTECGPISFCPIQVSRPCCLDDGTCIDTQPCVCEAMGGTVNSGFNCATMPDTCPDATGACCRANGICEITTEADCQGPCESYQGDNTECGPLAVCPIQVNRPCCLPDGTCADKQPCQCEALGGTVNPGTSCATMPQVCPEPTGRCCRGNGVCEETTSGACDGPCDIYFGDGTECDPLSLCPIQVKRPCCLDDGTCVDTRPCECEAMGGTVNPGINCTTMPQACPEPTGRCCRANGVCEETTAAACNGPCDFYSGDGTTCGPFALCPIQVNRPCCLDDGTCVDTQPCQCEVLGGTVNPGMSCDTMPEACPPPTGACCRENGVCEITTASDCNGACEFYLGDATECSPFMVCPLQINRPCCLDDGTCIDTQPCQCEALGGTVNPGASCTTMPKACPVPIGRCCRGNGVCENTTAAACDGPCDFYSGDGTACGPFALCPIQVNQPCCLDDGTCIDTRPCECAAMGGTVNPGTSCGTMPAACPVPTGRCCRGNGVCEETTAAACNGLCDFYSGDGTACEPFALCPLQVSRPCCLPDGTCVDTQPCECAVLGGTVNSGTSCVTTPQACP